MSVIVFPVSQPGNCSMSGLLGSPAPRNRQESHTVTLLFTQLLLNAGSTYISFLLTLWQSKRNTTHAHSNQWQIMNPSPRVSVCRLGRQHGGQGSRQHLTRRDLQSQVGSRAGKVFSPAGLSLQRPMPREISMAWSSTLGCGACLLSSGLEPASVTPWKGGVLHPSGSFDTCLGTPDAKCGISPGSQLWVVPLCRHDYSHHMCRHLRCVSLPDVSALT